MTVTQPIPVAYIDEMNEIDQRFRALIELCQGCCDPDKVQPFVLEQVGNLFCDLQERRLIVENFFLNRELDEESVDGVRFKAEICYLTLRHGTTESQEER